MRKWILALCALTMLWSTAVELEAAASKPVEVIADSIDYDSVKGMINAKGSVQITQENAILTGANAEYNTKSQEAYVTGGVKVVKDDMRLSAEQVRSVNSTRYVATGNAVVIKGDNTLTGPLVEYDSVQQYALVPADGRLTMPDGSMTWHRPPFCKEDNG